MYRGYPIIYKNMPTTLRTMKRQLIEYTNLKITEQETATKGLKNFHKGLPKFIFNTDNSHQPI